MNKCFSGCCHDLVGAPLGKCESSSGLARSPSSMQMLHDHVACSWANSGTAAKLVSASSNGYSSSFSYASSESSRKARSASRCCTSPLTADTSFGQGTLGSFLLEVG